MELRYDKINGMGYLTLNESEPASKTVELELYHVILDIDESGQVRGVEFLDPDVIQHIFQDLYDNEKRS